MDNLIYRKFGRLYVKALDSSRGKNKKIQWLCECECGKEKSIRHDHLIYGKTKSCGCLNRGQTNGNWKGVGELPKSVFYQIKTSANRRKIKFSVTIEDLERLFLKQNKKCALTGRLLSFGVTQENKDRWSSRNASLDRIDSSKDYVIDNLIWVDKQANMAKHVMSRTEFLKLCREVVEYEKINL